MELVESVDLTFRLHNAKLSDAVGPMQTVPDVPLMGTPKCVA
jgi:hypothetical protein